MKSRRLLILLLSLGTAIGFWCWARSPVWRVDGYEYIRPAGHFEKDGKLVSLVGRNGKSEWYIETRDFDSGRLMSDVKLDIPQRLGELYCLPMADRQKGDFQLIGVIDYCPNMPIKNNVWVFDLRTGARLNKAAFVVPFFNDSWSLGGRLAVFQEDKLILIDQEHPTGREIKYNRITSARIASDGTFVVVAKENGIHIVDWKSGQELASEKLPSSGSTLYLAMTRNNLIVVGWDDQKQYRNLQFRRWTGKTLEKAAHDVKLAADGSTTSMIGGLWVRESVDGKLTVASHAGMDWPEPYRVLCRWLTAQGLDLQRWMSHETVLLWYELDSNYQIARRFEKPAKSPMPLNERLAVEYPWIDTESLTMWNTKPKWPNAMAMGIVMYLLLYVWSRRKDKVAQGR